MRLPSCCHSKHNHLKIQNLIILFFQKSPALPWRLSSSQLPASSSSAHATCVFKSVNPKNEHFQLRFDGLMIALMTWSVDDEDRVSAFQYSFQLFFSHFASRKHSYWLSLTLSDCPFITHNHVPSFPPYAFFSDKSSSRLCFPIRFPLESLHFLFRNSLPVFSCMCHAIHVPHHSCK